MDERKNQWLSEYRMPRQRPCTQSDQYNDFIIDMAEQKHVYI